MFFMHPAYGYAGGWRNIAYGGTYQGPVAALANGLHSINWYGATGSYGYSGYSYTPTYCYYYQPRFMSSMFSYGSGGGYGYSTWFGPAGFYCYMGAPPYYGYNPYGYSTYDNGNNGRRYGYDTSGRPFDYDPDHYNKRPKRKKVEREDEEAPVSKDTAKDKKVESNGEGKKAEEVKKEEKVEAKKGKKAKKKVKKAQKKEVKPAAKPVDSNELKRQNDILLGYKQNNEANFSIVRTGKERENVEIIAKGPVNKSIQDNVQGANLETWKKYLSELKKKCPDIIKKMTFTYRDKKGKHTVDIK